MPTLVLGLAVSLLGWTLVFALPSPGLDVSWWGGLYMAAHDGLKFGDEIVFTYGPLGFMKFPWLWYGDLAVIAYIYGAILFVAFVTALIWTLRSRLGATLACLVTFLIISLVPGIDYAIAFAFLWALAVLSKSPPRHSMTLLYTAGALFAGAECLMKLSSGPVIFGVLLLALVGARAKLWQIGTFLGTFFVSFVVLWLGSGEGLAEIPDFIGNSIQIVVGYTEAMSAYAEPSNRLPMVLAAMALIIAWVWFGDFRDRASRYAGIAVVAVVAAAMYKQGVVRGDGAHLAIYFSMVMLLLIAVPIRSRLLPLSLVAAAVLSIVSIHLASPGGGTGIDVVENVRRAGEDAKTVLSTDRQQQAIDERRFVMQVSYAVPPRALQQLEGQGVSVEPFETGAAWAYELDWDPLPVFQSYSAYTPELDDLNSEALEDPSGPERILREASVDPALPSGGLDGRFLGWDPPGQAIESLCNFEPTATTPRWQVLSRVDERCDSAVPAGVVESEFDQAVGVPEPGPREVIFARIKGAEVGGLERIRSLLYKPRPRYAITSDGRRYRFLGATAEEGVMLRSGRKIPEGEGQFAQVPQTDTIELTGQSGDLTYEFFRMKVAG